MNKQSLGIQSSIAVLLASTLVVAAWLDAPVGVRIPLGLLVALVLPGWLGFRAVRGHSPQTLTDGAVSLIGSVGTLVALGICLDFLDLGLTPESWSLGLLVISVVLALAARLRIANWRDAVEGHPDPDSLKKFNWQPQQARTVMQIVVSAALLSAAAITAVGSQRAEIDDQPLTELWLTGDVETQLVHVVNHEDSPTNYRIVVWVKGQKQSTTEFQLADGKEWTTNINVPPRSRDKRGTPVIAVSLYRGDAKEAYRSVHVNWTAP
jgi:uncharacterized membrane protein